MEARTNGMIDGRRVLFFFWGGGGLNLKRDPPWGSASLGGCVRPRPPVPSAV